MHSKVHHPNLTWITEILRGLGKRSETGRPSLLLPNGCALACGSERDSQVLFVPVSQCFGITSFEEQASDSGYFFHLLPSRFMFFSSPRGRGRTGWLCASLCRHGNFIASQ